MSRRSRDKSHSPNIGPSLADRLNAFSKRIANSVATALIAVFQPKWLIRASNNAARKFFLFEPPSWAKKLGGVVKPPVKCITLAHFLNPFFWFVWAGDAAWKLLISRPYSSLGPALPAIISCMAILAMGGIIRLRGPQAIMNKYRDHLVNASRQQDYERAIIATNRLIDLAPNNLDFRFQRALLEEKRGNASVASEQIDRLAFREEHVPAAQYLLFNRFNLKELKNWSTDDHARFRKLLELSKRTTSSNRVQARALAASYYNAIGARQEAIRQISDIASESTELSLLLAALYSAEGDSVESKAAASNAERGLRKELQINSTNKEARINLARMLLIQEQERAAAKILLEGYQLDNDDDYRNGAAEALLSLSKRIASNEGENVLLERLQVIREATDIAPESPLVTDAIIDLVFQVNENRNQEVRTLGKAIVSGLSTDSAHFIRGTLALMQDDAETAKLHLEQAAKANPNLPGVLNNLAVAISTKSDGDLGYALKLAEAAVEQLPEHPFIRETRGQILCKLKRYSEAIPDLEYALRAPELAKQIHCSLAISYSALGQSELADEHRKLCTPATN